MAKVPDESVLFHGEVFNKKDLEKHSFPVGCKFHYQNASYNDSFTVFSIRKDPGAEYRQIVGSVAGEVWLLLSSLQREAVAGAVKYLNNVEVKPAKTTVAKKVSKKTSKKIKKK